MNMRIPLHIKDGGLKKKFGFTFGEGSSCEKKKKPTRGGGRGKENLHSSSRRGKKGGESNLDAAVKVGKRPRKGLEDLWFFGVEPMVV